jgi:hypothetical protein
MAKYRIVWSIDVDTDSYESAAVKALNVQRDCNSIATVFEVGELDLNGHVIWSSVKRVDVSTYHAAQSTH